MLISLVNLALNNVKVTIVPITLFIIISGSAFAATIPKSKTAALPFITSEIGAAYIIYNILKTPIVFIRLADELAIIAAIEIVIYFGILKFDTSFIINLKQKNATIGTKILGNTETRGFIKKGESNVAPGFINNAFERLVSPAAAPTIILGASPIVKAVIIEGSIAIVTDIIGNGMVPKGVVNIIIVRAIIKDVKTMVFILVLFLVFLIDISFPFKFSYITYILYSCLIYYII